MDEIQQAEPETGPVQFAGQRVGFYLRATDAVTLRANLRALLDDQLLGVSYVRKQPIKEFMRALEDVG